MQEKYSKQAFSNKKIDIFIKISILFTLIIYGYMGAFGFHQIADKEAQNPNNLIDGCMYYVRSYKDKSNNDVIVLKIDNKVDEHYMFYSRDFYKKNFPNKPQIEHQFNQYVKKNSTICHPIRYVKLDFIIDSKIFVYHYLGNFQIPNT